MKHGRVIIIVALVLVGIVGACSSPVPTATAPTSTAASMPSSTPLPSLTPTALPTSTPTPEPPKEFTVCQAEEPNTLFIYGGPSRAAWNVLAGVYDGPIDTLTYQFNPVILEKMPNLADGDAVLRPVQVREGDAVVDINGLAVDLEPGVTVLDADGQPVTFEEGTVIMAQMEVTFKLRAEVTWADGQPVTADDSRYSFELAGAFDSPSLELIRDRTASYEAVDERTVVWTAVPGYRDPLYFTRFYHPLPRHIWGVAEADQLLDAEVAHRKPLGWGPFVIEDWVDGEYVTMVRNPHYFRASEGLPYLDRVTFRFVSDLDQAIDGLLTGECDLISRDVIEGGDLTQLLKAADAGNAQLVAAPSSEWVHLDFGIQPAEWSNRATWFADVRVRQAVAQCVDRERIAREVVTYGDAAVAQSYVSSDHPLYAGDRVYRWDYDPSAGQALLDEAGWRDENGDQIREAYGVAGISTGTAFSVTLLVASEQAVNERTARIVAENLAACGIGVAVDALPAEELLADGPDGPVFGRQFDLVLFSWLNDVDASCWLYLSTEIPGPDNWWARSNNPGYASADYDVACQAALYALPGMEDYERFHWEAQRVFSHDLPVLPLYFVPKLVATRPGVSGVVLDPSEYLDLWRIEAFDVEAVAGQ